MSLLWVTSGPGNKGIKGLTSEASPDTVYPEGQGWAGVSQTEDATVVTRKGASYGGQVLPGKKTREAFLMKLQDDELEEGKQRIQ